MQSEMPTEKLTYKAALMSTTKPVKMSNQIKPTKRRRVRTSEEIVQGFLLRVFKQWRAAWNQDCYWRCQRCMECDRPIFMPQTAYPQRCKDCEWMSDEEDDQGRACVVCGEKDNDYPFCSRACLREYNRE